MLPSCYPMSYVHGPTHTLAQSLCINIFLLRKGFDMLKQHTENQGLPSCVQGSILSELIIGTQLHNYGRDVSLFSLPFGQKTAPPRPLAKTLGQYQGLVNNLLALQITF